MKIIVRNSFKKSMGQTHQNMADKHGVTLDQIEKELLMGEKVELEHTSDKQEAHKIAMDHVDENPLYYTKLKESGLADELEKSKKDNKDEKFSRVMREFYAGELTSNGKPVTDPKQAQAIAYSESGMRKGVNFTERLKKLLVRKYGSVKEADKKSGKGSLFTEDYLIKQGQKAKLITTPSAEYDRKYKLQDRIKWHGLDIAIENKKGSYRTGKDIDGKPWKTLMDFDYGRIGGTMATDSEGVDIFLGPDDTAEMIYVVHQVDPFNDYRYDEDKCMCGFPSKESAIKGYQSQYNRPDFLGEVSEFTIDEFKVALKEKRGAMLYKSPISEVKKTKIIVRRS